MAFSLNVPYTLPLMANVGRDPAYGTIKRGFVAEFDCTLNVEYSDADDWEVISVTVEQTRWNEEFSISEKSDPQMWKIIDRSMTYDWKDVSDRVIEMIRADISDRKDDVGDQRYEEMRDRDMEMGR